MMKEQNTSSKWKVASVAARLVILAIGLALLPSPHPHIARCQGGCSVCQEVGRSIGDYCGDGSCGGAFYDSTCAALGSGYTGNRVDCCSSGKVGEPCDNGCNPCGGGPTAVPPTPTATPIVANVVMAKTGPLAVAPGEIITYSVVMTNTGPNAANGVRVNDTVPASITGAAWTCAATSGSTCAASAGSGNVDVLVNLAVGGVARVMITGLVNPAATGGLANTGVMVMPTAYATRPPCGAACVAVSTLQPHTSVWMKKDNGVTAVVPGSTVVYTLTVGNDGPSQANGTRVLDALPAAMTGATWTCSASTGSVCHPANGAGDVDLTLDLAPAARATIVVRGQVDANATGELINTAYTTPPPPATDNPDDNDDTHGDPYSPQADVAIAALTVSPQVSTMGDELNYSIVVVNYGPSAATNVSLDNVLPTGVTLAGGSAGGSYDLGTLTVGQRITVPVAALVGSGANHPLLDMARVNTSATDPNLENNSATISSTLRKLPSQPTPTLTPSLTLVASSTPVVGATATSAPPPTLPPGVIRKAVEPGYVAPVAGNVITFTLVANNLTASTLNNVVVVDVLPAQLEFVTATATQGQVSYDPATNTIAAGLGSLAPGQTAKVVVVVRLRAGAAPLDELFNFARLYADGYPPATSDVATIRFTPEFPVTGASDGLGEWLGIAAGSALCVFRRRGLFGILIVTGLVALMAGGCTSPAAPTDLPTAPSATPLPNQPAAFSPTPTLAYPMLAWTPVSDAGSQAVVQNWLPVAATLAAWPTPTLPPLTPWREGALNSGPEDSRLVIPALAVDAPVVAVPLREGTWDVSALTSEIGWLQSTGSQPGDTLAMALAGHVSLVPDGRAGPFKNLATLQPGDKIEFHWENAVYAYAVVDSAVYAPEDGDKLFVSDGRVLLLTTCVSWDAARHAYLGRLVVRAEAVE